MGNFFSVFSLYSFRGKNGEHSIFLWTLLIIMVPLLAFYEFLPGSLNKLPDYKTNQAKIVRYWHSIMGRLLKIEQNLIFIVH